MNVKRHAYKFDENHKLEVKEQIFGIFDLHIVARASLDCKEDKTMFFNYEKRKVEDEILHHLKKFVIIRAEGLPSPLINRQEYEFIAEINLPLVQNEHIKNLEYSVDVLKVDKNVLISKIERLEFELCCCYQPWYKKLVRILKGKGERK